MPQKNKTIIELFNENKGKIATYLIILFVLIVIIRGYYIKNFIHPKLDKNTIYSGAILKDFSYFKGGRSINYTFIWKGNIYKGSTTDGLYNTTKSDIGKKFVVKINSKEPDYSKILTNYRLSDSIILPEEGWQKIEDVPYILNANEKESMWPRE